MPPNINASAKPCAQSHVAMMLAKPKTDTWMSNARQKTKIAPESSYEQALELNVAQWLWNPEKIKWVHPLPLIPSVAHFVRFQECRAIASHALLDSLAQEREKRASRWFSNWSSFVMLNGSNDLLHALRDLLKPETSRGHRRKSPLHCWAASFRMNGNHQPDALLPWCNVISWIQKWGMWSVWNQCPWTLFPWDSMSTARKVLKTRENIGKGPPLSFPSEVCRGQCCELGHETAWCLSAMLQTHTHASTLRAFPAVDKSPCYSTAKICNSWSTAYFPKQNYTKYIIRISCTILVLQKFL